MSLASAIKSFFTLTNTQQSIANNVSGRRRADFSFGNTSYQQWFSKHKPIRAAADLKLNADQIRLAARVAFFDSIPLHTVVERLTECIIAEGLKLEANPISNIIGYMDEEIEPWARDVETKFHLYASDKENHNEKNMSLYQLQALCSTQQHRDGEYFVRIYYKEDGIRFGLLDPDQIIPGLYNKEYHQGIIVNEDGAAIKYNVRVKETDYEGTLVAAYTSNGKPLILHGYMPTFAGQTRGLSRLAHVLQESKILTDYELAELYAAVQQSQMSFQIKPSEDAPSSGGSFDDVAFGSDKDITQTTQMTNDEDIPAYRELDEMVTNRPGSIGILGLGAGEVYENIRKTSPNLVFPVFFEAICQYISASMSIPLSVVKMLFHDSYSASRGELQLFWKIVNKWRQEIASDFLNIFYSIWLEDQIARGFIKCPGFSDPFLRKAWVNCNWIGTSIPQLDPNKQAMADKVYIQLGATTLKRVAREYNQSDAASNRAQLRRELNDLTEVPWEKSKQNGK